MEELETGTTNYDIKNLVIDSMIDLLNFARKLPLFAVSYDIEADNIDVEEWLSHKEPPSWPESEITEEEIEKYRIGLIEEFHKSDGYNPNGKSKMKFKQAMNPTYISFDNIREIVAGCSEGLPRNYKFIPPFKLLQMEI